jgi:hypothetical protein
MLHGDFSEFDSLYKVISIIGYDMTTKKLEKIKVVRAYKTGGGIKLYSSRSKAKSVKAR